MSEDIAWAAGLFEGEGCIHITKVRRPVLRLKSTDRDVVMKFAAILGYGHVSENRWYRRKGYQPQWLWDAGPEDEVKRILLAFYPYLGARRRRKADEVLALIEGKDAMRDHCRQGHPFDEANTYVVPKTGIRHCRTCARRRSRARWMADKQRKAA